MAYHYLNICLDIENCNFIHMYSLIRICGGIWWLWLPENPARLVSFSVFLLDPQSISLLFITESCKRDSTGTARVADCDGVKNKLPMDNVVTMFSKYYNKTQTQYNTKNSCLTEERS